MYQLQGDGTRSAAKRIVGTSWRRWARWGLAFLGFPLGGLAALGLVGGIESSIDALIGGLASGAVIGAAQWLAMQPHLGRFYPWLAATALGLGSGLALGIGLFGTDTTGDALLWRGALTGLAVGLAQWLVLRRHYANAIIWIPTITAGWALGWYITRAAGVDLSPSFSVFGSTGAWAFQLLMGLVLAWLLRYRK